MAEGWPVMSRAKKIFWILPRNSLRFWAIFCAVFRFLIGPYANVAYQSSIARALLSKAVNVIERQLKFRALINVLSRRGNSQNCVFDIFIFILTIRRYSVHHGGDLQKTDGVFHKWISSNHRSRV